MKKNILADDLDKTEEHGMENQKPAKSRRRLADSLNSQGRKLNMDRRVSDDDRRSDGTPGYKGPARRKIVDQRESLKDRRDED